ncbi:sugar phosphate nucleotidyltransferase [Botrimarina hoheduenensis]|uniref:Bifunctional protein GlmU n=1 Tax=Botrimarina hoheduenensis TaxID=2528000 RepID=A0A5C5WCB1_9BACT|nr:NTP transferase domain-containing protein [Botrimarina hoheduenensis]TWT47671.1 Bifunctional protein GlmU [Botrimarina hoheduenensis]
MPNAIAVVLAAGKGTRMKSDLPKVLVPACGRPMIRYVIDALRAAGVSRVLVVVGYKADLVRAELAGEPDLEFVEQTEQLGTGHAVMVCRDQLTGHNGPVVIVTGDSPLLQVKSLRTLLDEFAATQPACLLGTAHREDPTGLGRIVRDNQGKFLGIVEQKDATETQRQITEVNMSTYLFAGPKLLEALEALTTENAQQEYYITDCPGILLDRGDDVRALAALQPCEALSVNTTEDLLAVEAEMRQQAGSS